MFVNQTHYNAKKNKSYLSLIVFMVSTMGLTISKHYCGNHLESIGIFSSENKHCDIPIGVVMMKKFLLRLKKII